MDFDEIVAIGSRHSQLPNRDAYRAPAQKQLLRLIPADDALWIRAADRFGSECVAEPFAVDQRLSGDLTRPCHPRWQTAHTYERRRSGCPKSSPTPPARTRGVP
jgi:hypothetical protein